MITFTNIKELRKQLTLEEKIGMIHGAGLFRTEGVKRLGIPPLTMSDGPSGVRQEFQNAAWEPVNDSSEFVSWLPCNTCLASTWSTEQAKVFGKILGTEARGRGKDVILAPGINIKRTPLCGRNFEYMSEDPCLTSELAMAEIEAIQESDVAACVKHFALNNQEKERMSAESSVSEQALHEIYLPAFYAAAVKSHSLSIMPSYNQYSGEHCCHNSNLLIDILRTKWNYEGVTISDWGGVHDTKAAAENGLDIEMSVTSDFNQYFMATPLYEKVKRGEIAESIIDEKVDRILSLMQQLHMLGGDRITGTYNRPEHQQSILNIAEEGIILLKNDNNHLPLSKTVRKIAVIGQNAIQSHASGGGSAEVKTLFDISPLLGIKMVLGGNAEVYYAPGYYIDNKKHLSGDVDWQAESLTADSDTVNGSDSQTKNILVQRKELLHKAVALARECDEVIFIGGLNHAFDVEGFDRKDMKLPYEQNECIEALLQINPNTTIVLINGSPVEMPWLQQVHSLIQTGYCGMMGGLALANILFGNINPSGKLPESYPIHLEDCPAHKNESSYPGIRQSDKHLLTTYTEGIFVGYRYYLTNQKAVNFPFGHGLSYTHFEYNNLRVQIQKRKSKDDIRITVSLGIQNTGHRDGKEVVQLYIKENTPSVPRPLRELKAFQKLEIQAGEEQEVSFLLNKHHLAYYDENQSCFHANAGTYTIYLGSSCEDIRCQAEVELPKAYSNMTYIL